MRKLQAVGKVNFFWEFFNFGSNNPGLHEGIAADYFYCSPLLLLLPVIIRVSGFFLRCLEKC